MAQKQISKIETLLRALNYSKVHKYSCLSEEVNDDPWRMEYKLITQKLEILYDGRGHHGSYCIFQKHCSHSSDKSRGGFDNVPDITFVSKENVCQGMMFFAEQESAVIEYEVSKMVVTQNP